MMLKIPAIAVVCIVAIAVLARFIVLQASWLPTPIKPVASLLGIVTEPEELGWMDDAEYSAADQARVAALSGQLQGSNLSVIQSIKVGISRNVTRRDFELMRQDRRRAKAAYPDIKPDDLFMNGWLNIDFSAKIPDSYCTSGNSNGTQGSDGKWYLDGGCFVSFVRPQFTKRAGASETKAFLIVQKEKENDKFLARVQRWGYWGYDYSSNGSDGSSIGVYCYPDPLPSDEEADDLHVAGHSIIIIDGKTKYDFPFSSSDWVNPPFDKDSLTKLAESKGAKPEAYTPAPAKPWKMTDGMLAHGETCPKGRLCWSQWNGDGYDNKDIGPDAPESWVLGPVGLNYIPASDNGERRSVPGKPWYLVASYYGFPSQVSGGWTETDAKAAMPELQTAISFGMQGQDPAVLNRGNLREARVTQIPPSGDVQMLADRTLPVKPNVSSENPAPCSQGMMLMPGQSCVVGPSW